MNTNEVLKLALEALEYIHQGANNQGPHTGISWRCVSNKAEPAIAALRQAIANEALDKMAENARELGLDYEPSSVSKLAREAGIRDCTCDGTKGCLERLVELVRADERNSWPSEMEAMERQVNILTDALALARSNK